MHRLLLIFICAALPAACVATRAAAPPAAAPLRAVVISDLNAPYGSMHYAAEVHHVMTRIVGEWRPDIVLIAGDMVAGQSPQLPDSVVQAMWREFDRVVAAPLRVAAIPLVVTLGNHDGSAYPAHARDRRLAVSYWRGDPAPSVQVPLLNDHDYPLHYAARFGDVFIAAWDATNQESARDSALLQWLQRALASTEARTARHRVVLGHLPLYGVAVGRDRPGEVLVNGDSLRRQLETWGATLVISGHHHAVYPGRRGTLDLLHSGALGDGPRQHLNSDAPPRRTVTLLEFHADSLAMETWEVQPDGALQLLPLNMLPPVLCGAHGWVARRDLFRGMPENPC
jgi:hypothetical protein